MPDMFDQPELPSIPEAPDAPPWIKNIQWLLHHVRQEGAAIRKAPLAVLTTAVVISLLFWYWDKSRFEDQISNLTSAGTALQATIQFQNVRISGLEANFQNLKSDTLQQPARSTVAQNKYVCVTQVSASTPGKYGALVEFGVHDKPTNGFAGYIATSDAYSSVSHWSGTPLHTDKPGSQSGVYFDISEDRQEKSYTVRFSSPSITEYTSQYIYLEADKPMFIQQILYLEDILMTNPQQSMKMAAAYGECPHK